MPFSNDSQRSYPDFPSNPLDRIAALEAALERSRQWEGFARQCLVQIEMITYDSDVISLVRQALDWGLPLSERKVK